MKPLPTVLFVAAALLTMGHVGNPNVFFDGQAGPFAISITVQMPRVIPGEATVIVRAAGARRITVRPVRWDAGLDGAPPADDALPVRESQDLFTSSVWIMTAGSYYVEVSASGAEGSGTVYVPVSAGSATRIGLSAGRAALFIALAAVLVASAIAIVGGAARDALRPRGLPPARGDERRGRIAACLTACVLLTGLTGGARWWAFMDAAHRDGLFRPYAVTARIALQAGARVLELTMDDARWMHEQWAPLIPDHDKLMHVFVIRNDLRAFAHLHPTVKDDGRTFASVLPDLPAGTYRVYADITQESGFTQTLTTTLTLRTAAGVMRISSVAPTDPDDSSYIDDERPFGARRLVVRGERDPQVGRDWIVTGEAHDAEGRPAALEPYLGMLGHAVISRGDGAVFVHLHPNGSASMASQDAFAVRATIETPVVDPHHDHAPQSLPAPSTVSFRFVFPQPGAYRVWLQVRSGGRVATAPFDVLARPPS